MPTSKLARYQEMRGFGQSDEPPGEDAKVVPYDALRLVIENHAQDRRK